MANPRGSPQFEKLLNFRDVASSINNATGVPLLHPGLLYRSARPDEASPSDRERLLQHYKIQTILDLRTPTEHIEQARKQAGAPAAAKAPQIPGIAYRHINLNGSRYSTALIKQLSYAHAAKLGLYYAVGWRKDAIAVLGTNVMAARGLDGLAMDSLTHSQAEVKAVFDILCDPRAYPVLVHCTQGKDRTGLVVLLALMLCGVPAEAIGADYCLSQVELEAERELKVAEIRSIGLPEAFADCPADWTGRVCDYVNAAGGVEAYLDRCGVSGAQQERLKKLLRA